MKIAHIGDCHLGLGYPGPAPDSRLRDIENVMDWSAEKIIEQDCDLVLFAGDAFKDARVLLDRAAVEIRVFADWLRKLSDAEIPVVCISGTPSHDAVAAYEIIKEMNIPWVQIFTAPGIARVPNPKAIDVEELPFLRGDQIPYHDINIACLPGLNRSALASREEFSGMQPREIHAFMTGEITKLCWGLAEQAEGPTILLSHMTYAGADTPFDEMLMAHEPVLTQAAVSRFGLVCLGHIHKAQSLKTPGQPPVFYCGSPERISFNEENNVPGFWIHGADTTLSEFIETPARRYVTIDHTDNSYPDPYTWEEGVIPGSIVRLKWAGDEAEARTIDRKALEKALYEKGAFYVQGVDFDVTRVDRARNSDVTEALGPIEALAMWGKDREIEDETMKDLQALTSELIEEVAS